MATTRFTPPPGVPTLDNPDGDGYLVPGENDYTSETKLTLRKYISTLTRGATPEVNIPDGPIIEYSGPTPDHGNAYPLGDGSGTADSTFTELGVEGGGINIVQNYSDSGLFNGVNDKMLSDLVDKGELGHAQGRDPLSGHFLLQGVVGASVTNGVPYGRTEGAEVYVNAIPEILDKNLSSPQRTSTAITIDENDNEVSAITNRVKIDRGTEILSTSPGPNSERVSIEQLSKVAVDIMLRATGKTKGPDNYTLPGLGSPSQVQEGFARIDVEELRAINHTGESPASYITGEEANPLPTSDGVGTDIYTNKSFGVTYNPLESFTSLDGSVASYGILGASALGAALAMGGVLAAFTKPSRRPTYPQLQTDVNKAEYLVKGSFKFEPPKPTGFLAEVAKVAESAGISSDITQLLGIYNTTNGYADYGQCVILGFASLIGVTYTDDEVLTQPLFGGNDKVFNNAGLFQLIVLMGARVLAIALTGEKGYYMNLFREIIKDSGALLRDITEKPASLLTPSGIGALTNSKLVRFINTLAQIGDLIVLQVGAKETYKFNDEVDDPYTSGFLPDESFAVNTGAMQDFARQRIRGARFGSKRGSSLGVNELPSAHLMPKGYQPLFNDVSGNTKKLTSFKDKANATDGRTNLRIDQESVARLERVLDAEYMPFYFQDLRTNELIAFHAFLEDISDSYTANYNGTGGYGRIEEIKTYKDTKRSVGCTFQLVATNPEDFDYMWWQINKLTTMVYPQWSRGRELKTTESNSEFKFIQPFSQIPNATPIIRVRVGDLIRSNYSRFNLKRIFGYADPKTGQTGESSNVVYVVPPGKYEIDDDNESVLVTTTRAINLGTTRPTVRDGTQYVVVPSTEVGEVIRVPDTLIQFINPSLSTDQSTSFFNPSNNSIVRSFESTMGMGLAAVVTQLQFDWKDAMWGAGDDGPGYRAPRSCKVQMSFDPIHDFAPGLDHEGLNRAPLYPVGGLINRLVEGDESANSPYGVGSTSYLLKQS